MASTSTSSSSAFDGIAATAIIVTIFGWASSFPAIRAGLVAFGPIELGAVRFAVAALPAALFLLATRPALPARDELWRFAFGGVVFIALYTILLNIGELTVASGAASFIINTSPIITALFAVLVLGERFPRLAWIGTILSFAGVGLIALGENPHLDLGSGAVLILGSALCTAAATIVQKPLFVRHKALTVSAWNMVIGALCLLPALPAGLVQAQSASAHALVATVYLGIVPSLIAYGTWAIALSRLPAARASNYLYCIPPVATLMGYVWLGEVPTLIGIAGGMLALGGVVIVNLSRA